MEALEHSYVFHVVVDVGIDVLKGLVLPTKFLSAMTLC